MKKLFLTLLILGFLSGISYGASEWDKDSPAGGDPGANIDDALLINNEALDRTIIRDFRNNAAIVYKSTSDIYVYAGKVGCSNSAGPIKGCH